MSNDFFQRLRHIADTFPTRRDAAAAAGISTDQLTRYLRGENQPTFQAMQKLCLAAGMSLLWLASGSGGREAQNDNSYLSTADFTQGPRALPVLNLAESGQIGWFDATALAVSTTLDIPDPHAFAVGAQGLSLVPEGIQPGFLCICSPLLKPLPRDAVYVRRTDGRCTLMVYLKEDAEWFYLQAWLDPDKEGRQTLFQDQLRRSAVEQIAPIVMIKRRL
jgi:transcriptional regulator with XRE-family HTH domain